MKTFEAPLSEVSTTSLFSFLQFFEVVNHLTLFFHTFYQRQDILIVNEKITLIYSELAIKCSHLPQWLHNLHRNFIHFGLFTTTSLKSCRFLLSNCCFFIGSISIVLEYLQRKVPSARPGRKTSKESFFAFHKFEYKLF